jgi:hypothetical protein
VDNLTIKLEDFLDADLEHGTEFADLHITDNAEIIASDRVQSLLTQQHSDAFSFREVHFAEKPVFAPRYWHLVVHSTTGPALEPSPVERSALCPGCGKPREILFSALPGARGSEFYFSRSSIQGELIYKTTDEFGRAPSFQPIYFISQKLYRLFAVAEITGLWVQPAHLKD